MTVDYGQTIHLPKTDFPRRAGLPQKEPELLARWAKMGLYDRQRDAFKGREKFVLHMGPPFANGNIHIGHVLTTVLKDIVCKTQQFLGHDAPLVPGWDCHGLPIEWKIEEKYRAKDKNFRKEDLDPVAFRGECRDFAAGWIKVQAAEFNRLGIFADYDNPYTTMNNESEAAIAAEIHKFLLSGAMYQGSKPVMWSVPEQTALAEAEVEYKDMTSDTVWAAFPFKTAPRGLENASVVIWTTTPWTLPGNRAVAYGDDIDYVALTVEGVAEGSTVAVGKIYIVAAPLKEGFLKSAGITASKDIWTGKGNTFKSAVAKHPLHGKGYDFDVPLLAGDFVTVDAGTGFVHIAPGHGEDDYRLGAANGVEVPQTVGGDGKYLETVPTFAGAAVYYSDGKKGSANKLVMQAILDAGNLVAKAQITHSYPHSWRSKAPVIFRNTPQWFISMEKNNLREKALSEIKKTAWYPKSGENRLASMIEQRGEWCVSRQRPWGVPLAFFTHKKTGQPLVDKAVLDRTIDIFKREGTDAWWTRPNADFITAPHNADDFEKVTHIVDVWFESGCTQGFVLEQRKDLNWPADLYLEGSDQHRGWFQSSLLVSCGTRGRAPYKSVLTHGFILDEKGYKMSKSQGNVTAPETLMKTYGADILRLWVTGSDYTEDVKFGENIMNAQVDVYRRIRNTLCYLLGSIDDTARGVDKKSLSDLDHYILHRLATVDHAVRAAIKTFDFQGMMTEVHNFCARDLSAFYFDICKDTLYCEALSSSKRRGVVFVLDQVFQYLCHWLAPVLSFTAEEAWLSYKGVGFDNVTESIHLSTMAAAPQRWLNANLAGKWEKIITVRSAVTGALEIERAAKKLGASLEAAPAVHVKDADLANILQSVPFDDVCITSGIKIVTDAAQAEPVRVVFAKAEGQKCERCWKYTQDVGSDAGHPTICKRCANALKSEQETQEKKYG
jgi:isoleucyl-tRNA synthetase